MDVAFHNVTEIKITSVKEHTPEELHKKGHGFTKGYNTIEIQVTDIKGTHYILFFTEKLADVTDTRTIFKIKE